jgi:hypothetical protein
LRYTVERKGFNSSRIQVIASSCALKRWGLGALKIGAPMLSPPRSRSSAGFSPYGSKRVEAAAERAIEIGAKTYGSVKSILDNKLDRRPAPQRAADAAPIQHANIRGPRYYH